MREKKQKKASDSSVKTIFGKPELRALGREFRRLREEQNWTRSYVATQGGVSITALRNIEIGDVNPSLFTILRLAGFFSVSLDRLILLAQRSANAERFVHGVLPRQAVGGVELAAALPGKILNSRIFTIPEQAVSCSPDTQAPFFIYLLEGRLEVRFVDGRIEQLIEDDALHVLDISIASIENRGDRSARFLCFTDVRSQPSLVGGH